MRDKPMTKLLSLFISASLLISSFTETARAFGPAAAPSIPDFVRALTPPTHLGFVDSYYQGQTKNPVILIQDLHANYGVQKKIIGILQHLQPHVAQGGRPMVIGIEAAWGDIDLSFI